MNHCQVTLLYTILLQFVLVVLSWDGKARMFVHLQFVTVMAYIPFHREKFYCPHKLCHGWRLACRWCHRELDKDSLWLACNHFGETELLSQYMGLMLGTTYCWFDDCLMISLACLILVTDRLLRSNTSSRKHVIRKRIGYPNSAEMLLKQENTLYIKCQACFPPTFQLSPLLTWDAMLHGQQLTALTGLCQQLCSLSEINWGFQMFSMEVIGVDFRCLIYTESWNN